MSFSSVPPLPRAASSVVWHAAPTAASSSATPRSDRPASALPASSAAPARSVSAAVQSQRAGQRRPLLASVHSAAPAVKSGDAPGRAAPSSSPSPSSPLASSLPSASLTAAELSEWRTLSIPALSASESSIRLLASGKREELRQLVGVRYRVLLETADSIERMKAEGDRAHSDTTSIQAVLEALHELHTGAATNVTTESGAQSAPPSSTLSLLRCLSLTPLTLLQAARKRQWLTAVGQLNESSAVVRRLVREFAVQHSQVLQSAHSPVFGRAIALSSTEWSHVLHHRSGALSEMPSLLHQQAVRALHNRVILDAQELCECVSVIALTGGLSGAAVLSMFLSSRLSLCRRLLASAAAALQLFPRSSATVVVEECVVRLAQCILLTVLHTRVLFAPPSTATADGLKGKDEAVRSLLTVVPSELSGAAGQWMSDVAALIKSASTPASASASASALPSLLRRLRTGRQLSRVRERLLAVLALHQPLDGLSEHCAAQERALASNTDSIKVSGERHVSESDMQQREEADDEAEAEAEIGRGVTDSSLDPADPVSESELMGGADGGPRFPSESLQHSQHRSRDLLHSSWATVRGSSAALSVWDDCFADSFNSRCQELVHASFARFKFHETIEAALAQWTEDESSADGVKSATAAAVSSMWSGHRQSAVAALVSSFARQLERLAADVRHLLDCSLADLVRQATTQQASATTSVPLSAYGAAYAPPSGSSSSLSAPSSSSTSALPGAPPLLYPFDYLSFLGLPRFLDDELTPSLHRLYTASVHSMAEQLKRRLVALENNVQTLMASESSWRSGECRMLVERAVFIGRCCASITQQTAFASFSQALQQPTAVHTAHHSVSTAANSSSASTASSPIVAALSSTARSAFRIWSRFVANTVSDEMESSFAAWRTAADSQLERSGSGSGWRDKKINAQQPSPPTTADRATSMADGVSIPTQPSAYIHRVLWAVQQHTYSTHGYQTPNEVLRYMMQDTAIAVTAVLEAQLRAPSSGGGLDPLHDDHDEPRSRLRLASGEREGETTQPSASPFSTAPLPLLLQLYFDLLFLLSMMRLPTDTSGQAHKAAAAAHSEQRPSGLAVLAYVEGLLAARVSSAEWPVLRMSVLSSCIAALHRTQLLFGLLTKRNPLPLLRVANGTDGTHTAMTSAAPHKNGAASNNNGAATSTAGSANAAAAAATTAVGASTAASGLPLAATSSRIMTFSTSFYTHTNSAHRQQQQQQQQQPPPSTHGQSAGGSSGSKAGRSALSALPVALAATGHGGSSVAANAATVASESAALLATKGRQLLGKWNLV